MTELPIVLSETTVLGHLQRCPVRAAGFTAMGTGFINADSNELWIRRLARAHSHNCIHHRSRKKDAFFSVIYVESLSIQKSHQRNVKLLSDPKCQTRGSADCNHHRDARSHAFLQEFKAGATFAIPDGKTFTIENTGDDAIQIRVHVIRPQ